VNTEKYNYMALKHKRVVKWIRKPAPQPYQVGDKVVSLWDSVGTLMTVTDIRQEYGTMSGWMVKAGGHPEELDANWFMKAKETNSGTNANHGQQESPTASA